MVSACPFNADDGSYQGSIAMVTDVTDRRQAEADLRDAELERLRNAAEIERHRLEAELHQARRLESLGRPRGRRRARLQQSARRHPELLSASRPSRSTRTSPVAGDIAQIERAAEQATDVTRKLLTFGRADPVNAVVLDLNEIVANVAELVDRSFGEHFEIVTRLAAERCAVRIDPGQIEQLLMNLLVNARDALAAGGTITVATHLVPPGARRKHTKPIRVWC